MKTGFIAHCTIYFVQTSERFTLRVEPVGSSCLDDRLCFLPYHTLQGWYNSLGVH